MWRLCAALTLLLFSAAASFGEQILTQVSAADDGLIHIENLSGVASYEIAGVQGGTCAGVLAAGGVATCPAVGTWAAVSGNVRAYILFSGRRFYAVEQYYGRAFYVNAGTGFALVNPGYAQMDVDFVLYTLQGVRVATLSGAMAPRASLPLFAWQLFRGVDWGQTYVLAVGTDSPSAVMIAQCEIETCTCGQVES